MLSTSSPTNICEMLIKLHVLYYWHDIIHIRKSEACYSVIDHLKNWDKLKFGEKADLKSKLQSKSMHSAMFLKVNLGVVRALENIERTYLLDSNIKNGKTQQSCRIVAVEGLP